MRHFRRLGLQVDHYNQAGYTALHIAAKSGFLQCAKILAVKGKASLTIKDKIHGLTPLDWSLKEGYQKTDVEFLKPSAKFYRLAKLTTTMAKYRKRSSVTSQESLPQISDTAKPLKTVDKAKGKVKHLLKKSPQNQDDSEFMAIGAGCVPKQSKSSVTSKIPFSKPSSVDSSKTKSTGKKSWSKASRQRSLTLIGNKDNITGSKHKTALQHSISHPCPGKSEMRETDESAFQENHRGVDVPNSLAFYRDGVLHDELGAQVDTDEESSCSDTETVSLMESLKKSPRADSSTENNENEGWGVYCGEPSSSSEADRSSYGILSLSQYTDAGVYCGDIKSHNVKDLSSSTGTFPYQSGDSQVISADVGMSQKTEKGCYGEVTSPTSYINLESPITQESFTQKHLAQSTVNRSNGKDSIRNEQTFGYNVLEFTLDEEESTGNCTESSQSENSLSSPLTTMEIVGNTEYYKKGIPTLQDKNSIENDADKSHLISRDRNRKTILSTDSDITDLENSTSLQTEITEIEGDVSKLDIRRRDVDSRGCHGGDLISDSPETITSNVSSSSEVTEVSDCLTTPSPQVDNARTLKSPHTRNLPCEGNLTKQVHCKLPNSLSETSYSDYLDLSSSAVYSRRIQSKAVSAEAYTGKSSDYEDSPQTTFCESIEDDPMTDDTFLQDTRGLHSKTITSCPQNDRSCSAVEQALSQGFTSEFTDVPGREKIVKDKDQDFKAGRTADSSDKETADGNIETVYAKETALRITQNKTRDESHCNPMIASISQNTKSTHNESRLVNIHTKEQRKESEELSSVRIGQYTRDTKHIESIT